MRGLPHETHSTPRARGKGRSTKAAGDDGPYIWHPYYCQSLYGMAPHIYVDRYDCSPGRFALDGRAGSLPYTVIKNPLNSPTTSMLKYGFLGGLQLATSCWGIDWLASHLGAEYSRSVSLRSDKRTRIARKLVKDYRSHLLPISTRLEPIGQPM